MTYSLKKDEDYYIDQDGISYRTPEEWLWTGIMNACGCGSAEELALESYNVLDYFSLPHEDRQTKDSVYENMYKEVIAHWFSSLQIIDHGTSVAGGWLTDKGKNIYTEIKKNKE